MKDSKPWLPPLASLSNSQFRKRLARCLFDMFSARQAKREMRWMKGAYPRCIPIGSTAPMN